MKINKENTRFSNSNEESIKLVNDSKKEITPVIQLKSPRDFMAINDELNNESKFSMVLVEEEDDEINSDDYISSTMLDVETNTYIDYSVKDDNEKKLMESKNKNFKNYPQSTNIRKKDYLNLKIDSRRINQNKKNDYISYSPKNNNFTKSNDLKQKIKINDNNNKDKNRQKNNNKKKIIYKKLDVRDLQDKKRKDKINKYPSNYRPKKVIIKKNALTESNFERINSIYEEEFEFNKYNSINNYNDIMKKKVNGNKNVDKKTNIASKIQKQNKISKHYRSPTTVDNNIKKNNYIEEFFLKQKYNAKNKSRFENKNLFSPINNKQEINSFQDINTINYAETNNSIINQFIIYNKLNKHIRNCSFYNNSRTINSKNNTNYNHQINQTINFNNINKKINHKIYTPVQKIKIGKILNKNINSSKKNEIINSNSISLAQKKHFFINSNINQFSDKLLTYDFQDHHLLKRNRTFNQKRTIDNKLRYLSLILNKKKYNSNLRKKFFTPTAKSPRYQIKMNPYKNSIPCFKNIEYKIKKNHYLLDKNISNYNRNIKDQYKTINNNSKIYVFSKKDIPFSQNSNLKINPFNNQNCHITNKLKAKKLISKQRCKSKNIQDIKIKEKSNYNVTSLKGPKKIIKHARTRTETICLKKKNNQRDKTLIGENYLRDIINNSIKHDNCSNNAYFNNNSKKENKSVNYIKDLPKFKYNPKDSNSKNDMIIKSPSQSQNINFNININMNNNNYKKLVYHYHQYHRHSKSLANNNYSDNRPNMNINNKK